MSIYNLYPRIDYKISDYDSLRAIDITTSIKIKTFIKQYRGILSTPYVVKDGERPDQISSRFYGTPDYDWLVMLVNDVYSIYDDWPKSSITLSNYVAEKYGSVGAAQISYKYYNSYGDEIDLTSYNTLSESARTRESLFEYEFRKNLNKSKIKIIKPELIPLIDSALKTNVTVAVR